MREEKRVDKRTLKGKDRPHRQLKGVPKTGRNLSLPKYRNFDIEIFVPNVERYNTVQVGLSTWVHTDEVLGGVERLHSIIKRRIKDKARAWKQGYFKPETIVDVKGNTSSRKAVDVQFLNIDVVFFVRDRMEYDKITILKLLKPIIEDVIDTCIPDGLEITINEKMQNRSKNSAKSREN